MRLRKRITAAALAVIMVCSMFLGHLPENVFAAETKTMAHLKAGSGNANGHFGSATPEAFALSAKGDITNEAFSATVKLVSAKADTRLRFVTKYVDDTHWGYVSYDMGTWMYEYKNGDAANWPTINGLPAVEQNDVVNIAFEYVDTGLQVTVNNVTAGTNGTTVVTDANCIALKDQAGKVGFGAGRYSEQITDIYFSDVVIGGTSYTNYTTDFTLYNSSIAGQIFEVVEVEGEGSGEEPDNTEGTEATESTESTENTENTENTESTEVPGDDPVVDPSLGRAWYKITGGSNNGGGHNYGNAGVAAPVLLLDNDKVMENGGAISLAVKPSANWGVFYSYVDDNNWLYVGYDSSSQWYYQYKLNGNENYPKISGLPTPVEGEELQISISLSNETLAVIVNGVTVRVTNQTLIDFANQNAGKGRFGVKTNGATTISFADFKYNNADCMSDKWVFCAERNGQGKVVEYSPVAPVTGTVTDASNNQPIEGAAVYFGNNVAKTAADGTYSFAALELGTYAVAVSKPGYVAYSGNAVVAEEGNVFDIQISEQPPLDLTQYDTIQSDVMKVYIGKEFPVVARYEMLELEDSFFRGNENALNTVKINGVSIVPTVTVEATTVDSRTYAMHVEDEESGIDFDMKVKITVDADTLTWEVIELTKKPACTKIATIDVDGLNLLTISAVEEGANFAGAGNSTVTTVSGDVFQSFEDGFVPSAKDGYLYGILTNGKLSAGLYSNSEAEGDKRVIRNNGADTMSLTSAPWYYELGDKNGQKVAANYPDYPVSELPWVKVAIAADVNEDGEIDWNDGALVTRKIVHIPYGAEVMKDMVNYRIVMNFASMAPNPFLATADNIKKVYLATDGLPQGVVLKGYGNEGHDSANSEYADIAEREGGVEDFQDLIKIAHKYNTEVGIHINAQEVYPEAKSFNENMLVAGWGTGWGWLDQSHVIDKIWDLSTQARWKRLVQLYDRINGTNHLSLDWEKGEYVIESQGTVDISKEDIQKEAEANPDNMDFIYLDVWYQDAWETRRIAEEFNALGWRFSTEFSAEGEYDSTWHHWSTDAPYGGAAMKGYNSDIIRFIRNDQRDSQVLNYPSYGGTADNPLLGGYRLYGFEGWGGDQDFNRYIRETFNQNFPTRFLQHYYVVDWENYEDGQSPVGNHEKEITLWNDEGDVVVVTRNEKQRSDENIERTITLNGVKVLDDVTYLLPWTDDDGTVKLYHWNLDGGKTTWTLTDDFKGAKNVYVYELSDQGRINEQKVTVKNNKVTLDAKAATAYVVVQKSGVTELEADFGECDYVVDPGFNGYAAGEQLDEADWSGDITDASVVVEKYTTGDQRLAINSPKKEITLITKISGLEAGKDYVAEFNVQNDSDAKAYIIVNSGTKEVSNYTEESILGNYVQCDPKHGSKMQRMQVSFVAESTEAQLIIVREAGKGSTYIDDIRIVEIKLNNFREDGSFVQDFETVVQGLYPFVLSSAQGVSDPATHLSQLNAPYTQAGWNGRVIDDVITAEDGSSEWSLKHHSANTGIIYQTLPQNFRFEPGKAYTVEFDYQSGPDKAYVMVIGDGTTYSIPAADTFYPAAHGTTQHVTMQVVGSLSGQTWIGLYQVGNRSGSGSMGQTDFTLDNLVIREDKEATVISIEKTELFKGETTLVYGSGLTKATWTNSNEDVVAFDKETGIVTAKAAGTATLTATFTTGEPVVFTINVKDSAASDIPREEYTGITASANTEEKTGEGAGNGCAIHAVDGKSNTIWHSQWTGTGFTVSEQNPAIITVDLGKDTEIGGFKFQQRPSGGTNGLVQQYSYRVLAADLSVLKEGAHIETSVSGKANGAWETVAFDDLVNARYIEISVEVGSGGFAALAEICPVGLLKTTDTATLKNFALYVDHEYTLTPICPEGTVAKGLVWSSSNKDVAIVDKNGVVTGVGLGSAVITVTNATGLNASCTVRVIPTPAETTAKPAFKFDATTVTLDAAYPGSSEAVIKLLMNEGYVVENMTITAPNASVEDFIETDWKEDGTVSFKVVKAGLLTAGKYKVVATVRDPWGNSSGLKTATVTVNVKVTNSSKATVSSKSKSVTVNPYLDGTTVKAALKVKGFAPQNYVNYTYEYDFIPTNDLAKNAKINFTVDASGNIVITNCSGLANGKYTYNLIGIIEGTDGTVETTKALAFTVTVKAKALTVVPAKSSVTVYKEFCTIITKGSGEEAKSYYKVEIPVSVKEAAGMALNTALTNSMAAKDVTTYFENNKLVVEFPTTTAKLSSMKLTPENTAFAAFKVSITAKATAPKAAFAAGTVTYNRYLDSAVVNTLVDTEGYTIESLGDIVITNKKKVDVTTDFVITKLGNNALSISIAADKVDTIANGDYTVSVVPTVNLGGTTKALTAVSTFKLKLAQPKLKVSVGEAKKSSQAVNLYPVLGEMTSDAFELNVYCGDVKLNVSKVDIVNTAKEAKQVVDGSVAENKTVNFTARGEVTGKNTFKADIYVRNANGTADIKAGTLKSAFAVNVKALPKSVTLAKTGLTFSPFMERSVSTTIKNAELEALMNTGKYQYVITATETKSNYKTVVAENGIINVTGDANGVITVDNNVLPEKNATYYYSVAVRFVEKAKVDDLTAGISYTAKLKVSVKNTVPQAALQMSSVTLNNAFVNQEVTNKVILKTGTGLWTLDDLDNADIKVMSGKKDVTDAEYFTIDPDGKQFTISWNNKTEDGKFITAPKGTYKVVITPDLTEKNGSVKADDKVKALTFTVKVNSSRPTVKVASSVKVEAGKEQKALAVTLSNKGSLTSMTAECTKFPKNITTADGIEVILLDEATISVKAGEGVAPGKYTFKINPVTIIDGEEILLDAKTITVTVK